MPFSSRKNKVHHSVLITPSNFISAMHPIVPQPGSVADSQRNTNMVKPRSKVEKPSSKKKTSGKDKSKSEVVMKVEQHEGDETEEQVEEKEKYEEVEKSPQVNVKEEDTPQEALNSPEVSQSSELAENTDYIALTSALSMLTRQQETSKRDLVKLSQMRQQAVEQPEQFLEKVKSGQVSFPKALYVTMVPSIDWNQYDFDNRELDAVIGRQRKESEKGVVEEVPLFNQ